MDAQCGHNLYWKIEDTHSLIFNSYGNLYWNGLDCTEVYSIIRDGFPTNIMHISQELRWSGRTKSKTNNGASDNFDLIINTESFLYLNERLYAKENKDGSNQIEIIEHMEYFKLTHMSLLGVTTGMLALLHWTSFRIFIRYTKKISKMHVLSLSNAQILFFQYIQHEQWKFCLTYLLQFVVGRWNVWTCLKK